MWGAIIGDIIGSEFEFTRNKKYDVPILGDKCFFSDDSVCTAAIANWLLRRTSVKDELLRLTRYHNERGYGGSFRDWFESADPQPYDSWGNGAAMRVSPISVIANNPSDLAALVKESCLPTHGHFDAIRGATCLAVITRMILEGHDKSCIIPTAKKFGFDLTETIDEIRPYHEFDVSCVGTVPLALRCVVDANDYEGAIRNAISLGGDADTIAACAGGVAEALFGIPKIFYNRALSVFGEQDLIKEIMDDFMQHEMAFNFKLPRLVDVEICGPLADSLPAPLPYPLGYVMP